MWTKVAITATIWLLVFAGLRLYRYIYYKRRPWAYAQRHVGLIAFTDRQMLCIELLWPFSLFAFIVLCAAHAIDGVRSDWLDIHYEWVELSNGDIAKEAKLRGLYTELCEYMRNYFKDTEQPGWERIERKSLVKGAPPPAVMWAHPQHDEMLRRWAVSRDIDIRQRRKRS